MNFFVFLLALILAVFYGIYGRDALDYPKKGKKKPDIKTAARVHVFLYHFLGGFFGVFILSRLYQDIYINNQRITAIHLFSFILGFMGVMGYIPAFTNIIMRNIAELIKLIPFKK